MGWDVWEKNCATTTTTTLHPCDDGSHGCDTGPGGVCVEGTDGWECDCAAGYDCVAGCDSPHEGHTCSPTTTTTTTTATTTTTTTTTTVTTTTTTTTTVTTTTTTVTPFS